MASSKMKRAPLDAIVVNRRVYWRDPDDGLCSGWGYIDRIDSDGPVTHDTIITVRKDDGGEVGTTASELRIAAKGVADDHDLRRRAGGETVANGSQGE